MKVGIVWAGGAHKENVEGSRLDRRRSISLFAFSGLLDIPRIQFFSLQKGPPAEQIDALDMRSRLVDLMPEVTDFADTAAIINELDLIVAVDTSVAHLAGALAKPVWILTRSDADWRWLRNRHHNPWYPTARIFGQSKPGDWRSVIEEVKKELSWLAEQYSIANI
jgi:ADP-heptose:LPS heptosyltransferase